MRIQMVIFATVALPVSELWVSPRGPVERQEQSESGAVARAKVASTSTTESVCVNVLFCGVTVTPHLQALDVGHDHSLPQGPSW